MDFKKIIPHLIAFGVLLGVACLFFAPNAFSGKTLTQSDNTKARGMQTEIRHYRDSLGELPLWTNAAFGGMPSYQLYSTTPGSLTKPVSKAFFLWQGVSSLWSQVFAAMFCMYLFLIALRIDWRVAILGALAVGVTTYNVDILEAGHTNKMMALALAPGLLAGAVYAFRGHLLFGGAMLALFASMQLNVNHPQITYYTFLLIGLMWLVKLVYAFQNKGLADWGKAFAATALAIVLGFAGNLNKMWPTYEYSQETIRGKSELTPFLLNDDDIDVLKRKGLTDADVKKLKNSDLVNKTIKVEYFFLKRLSEAIGQDKVDKFSTDFIELGKIDKVNGLSTDYLFGWSYGIAESMTIMAPHAFGGGAGENFEDTEFYKKVGPSIIQQATQSGQRGDQAKEYAKHQVASLMYSGAQPFVGTAIYFGAVILFLAFVALFLVPGEAKTWLAASAFFMLTLAWGKNFFVNDWLYDYFPMFKKFRAVSMAMGISQLCFAALAALGLQKMVDGRVSAESKKRSLFYGAGVSFLLLLIAMMTGGGSGPNDGALGNNAELLKILKASRADLLRADVLRSFAFIAAAFALLWFYIKGNLKAIVTVVLLGFLALADHWLVATRTLRPEKYEPVKEATAIPKSIAADKEIMKDPDPHFRVLDLFRGGVTGNATASFFHKSISGYHAAKLQRFQEVVDAYFTGENARQSIQKMAGMLNGKYIINKNGQEERNPFAMGNAWFVQSINVVDDADKELEAIGRLDPKNAAIVQRNYANGLDGFTIQPDSSASIRLTSYHPDKMEYAYSAKTDQFAVFSEVYYPPSKGWKVSINGQPVEGGFTKADYFLRGLHVPAAENGTITMTFDPDSVRQGKTIAGIASGLVLLMFLGGLFHYIKNNGLGDNARMDDMKKEQQSKAAREKTVKSTKRNDKKRG